MRACSGGREMVEARGKNVRQLIHDLETHCPGIRDALLDGERLKADVAVAVDGQIAQMGLLQPLEEAREVSFIPAIGGG